LLLKLLAEGAPAKQQIVLGWLLDTRRLWVALPEDKYKAWLETLQKIVTQKQCTDEGLETL
jgi:hypothetical protein